MHMCMYAVRAATVVFIVCCVANGASAREAMVLPFQKNALILQPLCLLGSKKLKSTLNTLWRAAQFLQSDESWGCGQQDEKPGFAFTGWACVLLYLVSSETPSSSDELHVLVTQFESSHPFRVLKPENFGYSLWVSVTCPSDLTTINGHFGSLKSCANWGFPKVHRKSVLCGRVVVLFILLGNDSFLFQFVVFSFGFKSNYFCGFQLFTLPIRSCL